MVDLSSYTGCKTDWVSDLNLKRLPYTLPHSTSYLTLYPGTKRWDSCKVISQRSRGLQHHHIVELFDWGQGISQAGFGFHHAVPT